MPSKFMIKEYIEGGVYHVYNRGVDKRAIFLDDYDYRFFLYLLKSYLVPKELQKGATLSQIQRGQFAGKVELLAYALMPNHYHLLLRQTGVKDFPEFMRSVMTNYVMYFNKKYDRVGPLFQGSFKAIRVENNEYLVHLSRYIHLNPLPELGRESLEGATLRQELIGQFTSYVDYLGLQESEWVKPQFVLDLFATSSASDLYKSRDYAKFVEEAVIDDVEVLGNLALEN